MSLPPEEPTRPLGTGPPAPVHRETVVEDPALHAEVAERLRSLRAWTAIATVLSLLALGVAGWSLLGEDDDRDGNRGDAVRATELDTLEDRIDKLETQPDKGVAEADFAALQEEQAALAGLVDELAARTEAAAQEEPAAAEDAEARESIAALDASVQDLDERVRALEEQQAAP